MVHTAHTKQGDCSQMALSIKHISKVAVEVLVHTAIPCFGIFLFQLQMSTRTMECLRGISTSVTVLRVNNTTALERREHSLPKMASQPEVTWAGTSTYDTESGHRHRKRHAKTTNGSSTSVPLSSALLTCLIFFFFLIFMNYVGNAQFCYKHQRKRKETMTEKLMF